MLELARFSAKLDEKARCGWQGTDSIQIQVQNTKSHFHDTSLLLGVSLNNYN